MNTIAERTYAITRLRTLQSAAQHERAWMWKEKGVWYVADVRDYGYYQHFYTEEDAKIYLRLRQQKLTTEEKEKEEEKGEPFNG